jgi:phospholipid/cholesterol/gamma-HCH transport system substrate-binding protein
MSTPTNHWKLGLFVVVGLLVGVMCVVYFGARSIPKETVTYTSYFDEAVTGLENGSPVKFRGVTIGNITRIEVAQDRRHVKVAYELTVSVLRQLGIAGTLTEKAHLTVSPNLRAQLNTTGVTGVKYLQIDFFDEASPIEPLPFKVTGNYIPTTPSSLKNIEGSVVRAADRLPELTEQLVMLIDRFNRVAGEVEQQQIPARVGAMIGHADRTLSTLDEKLQELDTKGISAEARNTLANLNGTAARANQLLDKVGGEQGLVTSAQRVTDSFGDAARNASGVGSEVERTLRDVSEAAASIKDLADAIERQPDMLLKGRAARAER